MKKTFSGLAASAAVFAFMSTASAQDHSGHSTAAAMELPPACQTAQAPKMPGMENMQTMMEGRASTRPLSCKE